MEQLQYIKNLGQTFPSIATYPENIKTIVLATTYKSQIVHPKLEGFLPEISFTKILFKKFPSYSDLSLFDKLSSGAHQTKHFYSHLVKPFLRLYLIL